MDTQSPLREKFANLAVAETESSTVQTPEKSTKSPTTWTCPFCCSEFLFEFSLTTHIQKHHNEELQKLDSWPVEKYYCGICNCFVYYSSLLPKHIYFSHGKSALDEHFDTDDNFQKFQQDKENGEPTFKIFDCSPGISDFFNGLETCDSIEKSKLGSVATTPVSLAPPRSILKTPYSGRPGRTPESVALHRTLKSMKRSYLARRELRFDLPPPTRLASPSPIKNKEPLRQCAMPSPKTKKGCWSVFNSKRSQQSKVVKIKKKIRIKACKMSNFSANQIITSTPKYFLEDNDEDCSTLGLDRSIDSNWKSAVKTTSFRPLLFAPDRFQCNLCEEAKFNTNAQLLTHHKSCHRRISLHPPYRCGQCTATFYRNTELVKHCQHQHTPTKV